MRQAGGRPMVTPWTDVPGSGPSFGARRRRFRRSTARVLLTLGVLLVLALTGAAKARAGAPPHLGGLPRDPAAGAAGLHAAAARGGTPDRTSRTTSAGAMGRAK